MDENIKERLEETSKNCIEAFSTWNDNKKDAKAQEDLHGAIHELRKVSSRLEIELAISERDQMTSKPLPIPAHRSNSKSGGNNILEGEDQNSGGPVVQTKTKRRRSSPKKQGGDKN